MRPAVRIALSVWVVVLWLGFLIPVLMNYHAQSKLERYTAQDLVGRPPGTGWYQLTGGMLDYPHAVGHEVSRPDERGMARFTYETLVPYFDPNSGKVVVLVLFEGADSAPNVMKAIDAEAQAADVNGTVDSGQAPASDLLDELKKDQVQVDARTPVLQMFGAPPKDYTSAFVGASVLIVAILLILINVVRWRPRAPWEDFDAPP